MRGIFYPAWAGLFLLLLSSAVSAQGEIAAATPPKFVVGDTWAYKGYSSLEEARSGQNPLWESIHVVQEVRQSGEILVGRKAGSSRDLRDRDFNLVERHRRDGVAVHRPFRPSRRYPLVIGDRYDADFVRNSLDSDRMGEEVQYKVNLRVVGWETVTVPAGTFKALRVENSGEYRFKDAPYRGGTFEEIEWIAPEVKMNSVLYSYVVRWQGGGASERRSLSSFSMK